jgi:Family of unknown function (DUF5995)
MRALEDALPPGDGVALFLRLYRPVTEDVEAAAASRGTFGDPRSLRWLDVVFANLFFRGLRDWGKVPATVPRAWEPFFAARSRPRIAPIQFALAGMNAHINPRSALRARRDVGGARARAGPARPTVPRLHARQRAARGDRGAGEGGVRNRRAGPPGALAWRRGRRGRQSGRSPRPARPPGRTPRRSGRSGAFPRSGLIS